MRQLAPHHREVILLRDFERLEWREIAKKMGKDSARAARMQHARAFAKLARLLLDEGRT